MSAVNLKDGPSNRELLGAVLTGWVLLSVLVAIGVYLDATRSTEPVSVEWAFGQALLATLAWAVVALLLVWWGRRMLARAWSGKFWLLNQLVFGAVLVLIIVFVSVRWQVPVLGLAGLTGTGHWGARLVAGLARGFAIYMGIWGICQAGLLWRQHKRVKHALVRAELHRLRTQLNPHFLFNTLNAISELGYEDPEAADRTVTQLSGLLRKSLSDSQQQEIALRDELDFLKHYLAIQQTLLQNRLQIELEISEDTLNARVPGMILQPLVENAITHGIGRSGKGEIKLRSTHRGDWLVIEVEDNGWGLAISDTRKGGAGIGIKNTTARLRYLYGELGGLELHSRPGEGLTACLKIPFHEAYAYDEYPHLDS